MSETVAPFRRLLTSALPVLPFLFGGAVIYLMNGPDRLEFAPWPGGRGMATVGFVLFLLNLLPLIGGSLNGLPRHGVIEPPAGAGRRWARSVLSRVRVAVFGLSAGWVGSGFVAMVFQAVYQGDWLRMAIAALTTLMVGGLAGMMVLAAVSRKPMLSIDADGLRDWSLGDIAWRDIEKIGLGRARAGRSVYLFPSDSGRGRPVKTLRLDHVGLTAEQFLAAVEAVAPQVLIDWPEPAAALFA